MLKILFLILGLFFGALFLVDVKDAYAGPGHGEPIIVDLGGRQVGIETKLLPLDITLGNFSEATMSIRFYDVLTDQSFDDVTYFVEIWRDEELLARELFFDFDGNLEVKIRPIGECNEIEKFKCTEYFGAREPITGGYYDLAGTPIIKGPILIEGGIYTLKIEIVGATGMTAQLVNPIRIQEQFSVPQEQTFNIVRTNDEFSIIVKTYYDLIDNFTFDEKQNSITFDMPFDWNPSIVNHTGIIHEEIRVPKFVKAYAENTSFQGIVDGIEMSERAVILDPYSYVDYNVLHFIVANSNLKDINNKLGSDHHSKDTIQFTISPTGTSEQNSVIVDFDTGAKANISVIKNTEDISNSLKLAFFDDVGKLLRDVRYGYEIIGNNDHIVVTNTGNDPNKVGILTVDGIDIQNIDFLNNGEYTIKLVLFEHSTDSNYRPNFGGGFGQNTININVASNSQSMIQIPSWVKNNAGLWSDEIIDDNTFVSGIQYLIEMGIIRV